MNGHVLNLIVQRSEGPRKWTVLKSKRDRSKRWTFSSMNVYFDAYYPISFWTVYSGSSNLSKNCIKKPLSKSQKLTLCNASRVGNIQHVENKIWSYISQHLKKSLLYPENKFEIFFWQKCQNLSMQRMLIRLDHWDEPLNTRTVH